MPMLLSTTRKKLRAASHQLNHALEATLEQRQAAIATLREFTPVENLVVDSLIVALRDETVGGLAREAIVHLLQRATTRAEMEIIIRPVVAYCFDSYFTPQSNSHHLLEDVLIVIKKRLPEANDYIPYFADLAANGRKIATVNSELAQTLIRFIRTDPDKLSAGVRSRQAFADFDFKLGIRTLLDPRGASPQFLLSYLEQYGIYDRHEMSYEIVAAHVSLLGKIKSKTKLNPQIVKQTLQNLLKWCPNPPTDHERLIETQQIRQWQLDQDKQTELPATVYQRIAYNYLLVKPIVELLTDQLLNIVDKAALFQLLGRLSLSKEQFVINDLTNYINEVVLNFSSYSQHQDFPFTAAVQFLNQQLTGLNRFLHLTEAEEQLIFGSSENRNNITITSKGIVYVDKIVTTLNNFVIADTIPTPARQMAMERLIRANPHQLLTLIEQWKNHDVFRTSLLKETLYRELGAIKLLESLPYLLTEWRNRTPEQTKQNLMLLQAITAIGTHKILGSYDEEHGVIEPDLLLKDAFEEEDDDLRTAINNQLRSRGFMYAIDRESKRRHIISRIKTIEKIGQQINQNETYIKETHPKIHANQIEYNQHLTQLSYLVSETEIQGAFARADLLPINIDAGQLQAQLEDLEREASHQFRQIENTNQRVNSEQQCAKRLDDEFRKLGKNINSLHNTITEQERKCIKAQRQKEEAEDIISSTQTEIPKLAAQQRQSKLKIEKFKRDIGHQRAQEKTLESDIRRTKNSNQSGELNQQIEQLKASLNTKKNERKRVERDLRNLKEEVNQIHNREKKQQEQQEKAARTQSQSQSTINTAQQQINNLQRNSANIARKRDEIAPQVQQSQQQIAQQRSVLQQQRLSLEAIKQRIEQIKNALKNVHARQKNVHSNFQKEMDAIEKNRQKHQRATEHYNQEISQMTADAQRAIKQVEDDKTNIQTSQRELDSERVVYDQLGQQSFETVNIKHQEHEAESREVKIEQIDRDLRAHFHFKAVEHHHTKGTFEEENRKAVLISTDSKSNSNE